MVQRVHRDAPGAQPIESRFEPAIGAVLLALEAAGVTVDETVLSNVRQSMPPPTLFATAKDAT